MPFAFLKELRLLETDNVPEKIAHVDNRSCAAIQTLHCVGNTFLFPRIPTPSLLGLVKHVTNPKTVCVGAYAHEHYNINSSLKSHFTLVI